MHKALITGGTGFVGSNLARRLVRDGWQVGIITIPNDNLDQIKDFADQVKLYVHDGSTDRMHAIVAEAQPDVVFHLASLFLSEHTPADITRLVSSNVLFGTQLLEAMAAQGVAKIVNTGTSWQHYENKPYSPVNLYAATKQAFEDILQYYVEARDVQAITLKLFDTYGPNDPRPKLFHLLDKIAREGTTLAMSPGEQMIDLVHIDDIVRAFVMAAERLMAGEASGHEKYGVSSEKPMPLKELVELYGCMIGSQLPIEWGGRPYRDREVMVTCTSLSILAGWSPEIRLEDGIRSVSSYCISYVS
ncbi:MAG: NAD-dependent dehydratase [Geobacteraceae bacterium GWC2_53_11]|nr:MAG: NAD-dependent dehydratase [Geobacteraceae bacterium GWC2_53_11]